jgi:hypothetical protein
MNLLTKTGILTKEVSEEGFGDLVNEEKKKND